MNNSNEIVVAVKGIILNNGKLLIVKRSHTDQIGPGNWELAGGKIEFGEDLETALVREINEETGLNVNVDKILYAITFNSNPTRQVVILTYLCTTDETEVTLSYEHSDYQWVTKEQTRTILNPEMISDFEKNNVFDLNNWL